jgi:ribosome maturation factor RimP
MIEKETVKNLIDQYIAGSELFIVDIHISTSNNIRILIDSPGGISLGECIDLSKAIEKGIDRDKHDFELEVSSPGLSEPLKVLPQYIKNTGREVEVTTLEGLKHVGKLIRVAEKGIVIEETIRQRSEKKRPEVVSVETELDFNRIRSTKVVVSYK